MLCQEKKRIWAENHKSESVNLLKKKITSLQKDSQFL
jgi:hypothetical protein